MSAPAAYCVAVTEPDRWEPYMVGDQRAGEVAWLRRSTVNGRPLSVGIWRALPGQIPETVPYLSDGNESFHVLEGAVTIEVDGEAPVRLEVGDIASSVEGTASTWSFVLPFKKFFVIS